MRPYLLLPKYVFVSIFIGGLISLLVLCFLQPPAATLDEWHHRERQLGHAYVFVIVPGLLGGIIMGLILLSTHFSAFIRMRWMQVKLVLVVIGVPCFHFYMRGRALVLHAALAEEPADLATAAAAWQRLQAGTVSVIVFGLVLIYLGRIKPRLGQDYGRTFGQRAKMSASLSSRDQSPV